MSTVSSTSGPNQTSLLSKVCAQQGATGRYSEKNDPETDDHNPCNGNGLSQRQLNAVALLLQGLSDAQVAQQVGVDRGTVFRWRKEERFAQELEEQRRILLKSTMARLQGMLEPALDILQRQLNGDDPKTALRAAAILLRIATPARLERPAPAERLPPEPSFIDQLKAYIDAPLPNEPGHPAYDARRRQQSGSQDLEDDELDED